ncbi:MAG TPA: PfkB family carbohydrate kinase [Phycisphaerae bacterium]
MSLLVTGSIGIDTVTTPHGEAVGVLGGSAVYFSFAASAYVPVRLVGVVGDDFPDAFHEVLRSRPIDLAGLERRPGSKTFRWTGRFNGAMNEAQTVDVQLNVLAEDGPRVPPAFADSRTVFLANTHPRLQRGLLRQLHGPRLTVCDTMNHWITTERDELQETLAVVDGVILNDGEARLLTGEHNLIAAGERIRGMGPEFVIIKKGEHGAILFTPEGVTSIPAFPTHAVRDPTGAGDSFAGGILGYVAQQGRWDHGTLRRALVHGTVASSFAIEDFSLRRMQTLTKEDIERRVAQYLDMLRFE